MKKNTSWGKMANWYNKLLEEGEDTYQEKLIKPNLLRILSPIPGQQILDIGCGQGYFARLISKEGAKVVGIDIAPELVKIAKSKAGEREIYLVLSAEKMSSLTNARFDAAICVLALQNIKNLQPAINETARVLKKNGKLVIVLNHPAFRIPSASEWVYDQKRNIQFRAVSKYLSEISQKVDMTQGEKDSRKKIFTFSFHRSLQVYFKSFAKAGFCVTKLEEWTSHKISATGLRKVAEDISRQEIPLFMCLELKKTELCHE